MKGRGSKRKGLACGVILCGVFALAACGEEGWQRLTVKATAYNATEAQTRKGHIGLTAWGHRLQVDDKVIAVHVNDPSFNGYRDIAELPQHVFKEIERFFQDYKALEPNKSVDVEEFLDSEQAVEAVKQSFVLYRKEENRLRGW